MPIIDYQYFRQLRPDYANATDEEIEAAIKSAGAGLPTAPSSKGDFARGFSNRIPQTRADINAAQALAGEGLNRIFGPNAVGNYLVKSGLEGIANAKTQIDSRDTDEFDAARKKGLGGLIDFAQYQAGQGLASLVETLALAGLGATAGMATGGPAVSAAGTVTGVAARSLLRKKMLEEVKELALKRGNEAARRAAGRALGAEAGLVIGALGRATGEVSNSAIQAADGTTENVDLGRVAIAVPVHAAAERLSQGIELGALGGLRGALTIGKNGWKALPLNVATNVLKTGALEAPVEVIQTGAERYGAGLPLTGDEAKKDYINSAAAAMAMGIVPGTIGGVRGAVFGKSESDKPAPKRDVGERVGDAIEAMAGPLETVTSWISSKIDDAGQRHAANKEFIRFAVTPYPDAKGKDALTYDTELRLDRDQRLRAASAFASRVVNPDTGSMTSSPGIQTASLKFLSALQEAGVDVTSDPTNPRYGDRHIDAIDAAIKQFAADMSGYYNAEKRKVRFSAMAEDAKKFGLGKQVRHSAISTDGKEASTAQNDDAARALVEMAINNLRAFGTTKTPDWLSDASRDALAQYIDAETDARRNEVIGYIAEFAKRGFSVKVAGEEDPINEVPPTWREALGEDTPAFIRQLAQLFYEQGIIDDKAYAHGMSLAKKYEQQNMGHTARAKALVSMLSPLGRKKLEALSVDLDQSPHAILRALEAAVKPTELQFHEINPGERALREQIRDKRIKGQLDTVMFELFGRNAEEAKELIRNADSYTGGFAKPNSLVGNEGYANETYTGEIDESEGEDGADFGVDDFEGSAKEFRARQALEENLPDIVPRYTYGRTVNVKLNDDREAAADELRAATGYARDIEEVGLLDAMAEQAENAGKDPVAAVDGFIKRWVKKYQPDIADKVDALYAVIDRADKAVSAARERLKRAKEANSAPEVLERIKAELADAEAVATKLKTETRSKKLSRIISDINSMYRVHRAAYDAAKVEGFNLTEADVRKLEATWDERKDDKAGTAERGVLYFERKSGGAFPIYMQRLLGIVGAEPQETITSRQGAAAIRDKVVAGISSVLNSGMNFTGRIGYKNTTDGSIIWLTRGRGIGEEKQATPPSWFDLLPGKLNLGGGVTVNDARVFIKSSGETWVDELTYDDIREFSLRKLQEALGKAEDVLEFLTEAKKDYKTKPAPAGLDKRIKSVERAVEMIDRAIVEKTHNIDDPHRPQTSIDQDIEPGQERVVDFNFGGEVIHPRMKPAEQKAVATAAAAREKASEGITDAGINRIIELGKKGYPALVAAINAARDPVLMRKTLRYVVYGYYDRSKISSSVMARLKKAADAFDAIRRSGEEEKQQQETNNPIEKREDKSTVAAVTAALRSWFVSVPQMAHKLTVVETWNDLPQKVRDRIDEALKSVADIRKLVRNGGESLEKFADTFASRIKQKDTTIEDADRIAKQVIKDFIANPKMPEVTGPNLKPLYMAKLIMPDGARYDPNNLAHANADANVVEIHNLLQSGRLDQYLEQVASEINSKRMNDILKLARYLDGNNDYTPTTAALILEAARKYSVTTTGNEVRVVDIAKNNEANVMVVDGMMASRLAEELRKGLPLKKALKAAVEASIEANKIKNKQLGREGWVKFAQSDKYEDAVELNKACAGTSWCTGGSVNTALAHRSRGDFYVFFKDGRPFVAVRKEGGTIAEIAGATENQSRTPEMEEIVEKALRSGEIEGGEDFLHDRDFIKSVMDGTMSDEQVFLASEIRPARKMRNGYGEGEQEFPPSVYSEIARQARARNLTEEKGFYKNVDATNVEAAMKNAVIIARILNLPAQEDNKVYVFAATAVGNIRGNEGDIDMPNAATVGTIIDNTGNVHVPSATSVGNIANNKGSVYAPSAVTVEDIYRNKGDVDVSSATTVGNIYSNEGDVDVSSAATVGDIFGNKGDVDASNATTVEVINGNRGNVNASSATTVGGIYGNEGNVDVSSATTVGVINANISDINVPNATTVGGILNNAGNVYAPSATTVGDIVGNAGDVNVPSAIDVKDIEVNTGSVNAPSATTVGSIAGNAGDVYVPSATKVGPIYENISDINAPNAISIGDIFGNKGSVNAPKATTVGNIYENIGDVNAPSATTVGGIWGNKGDVDVSSAATAGEIRDNEGNVYVPNDVKIDPSISGNVNRKPITYEIPFSKRQGEIQAFVLDDHAYMIADRIKPGEERSVFLHEVGAHLGLTDEQIARAAEKVKEWANAAADSQERQVYDATMRRLKSAGESSDAELVAYATEEAVKAGVTPQATTAVGRFLQLVKSFFEKGLKKLFGTTNMTAQDLVDLTFGAAIKAVGARAIIAEPTTPQPAATQPASGNTRFSHVKDAVDAAKQARAAAEAGDLSKARELLARARELYGDSKVAGSDDQQAFGMRQIDSVSAMLTDIQETEQKAQAALDDAKKNYTPQQSKWKTITEAKRRIKELQAKNKERIKTSFNSLVSTMEVAADVQPVTEEEAEALKTRLRTLLGDKIKMVIADSGLFAPDGKAVSGEWDLAERLIRISAYAVDKLGVLNHEAMHELVQQLRERGNKETLAMLERLAKSPIIRNRLEYLLRNEPAALEQLNDPDEFVAYVFQFYASGQLQLGPRVGGFLQKVVDILRTILGLVSDHVRDMRDAEAFMRAFDRGELKDDAGFNAIEERLDLFAKARERRDHILNRVGNSKILKEWVYTAGDAFESSGNKYLKELGRKFFTPVGASIEGEASYYDAAGMMRNRFLNRLSEIIKRLGGAAEGGIVERQDLDAVDEYMTRGTALKDIPVKRYRDAVRDLRKLLSGDDKDSLLSYAREAGVMMLDPETGQWKAMGDMNKKGKPYYPRNWNVDELLKRGGEFVQRLIAVHYAELDNIRKAAEIERLNEAQKNKDPILASSRIEDRPITVEDIAQSILLRLTNQGGAEDITETTSGLGITPYAKAVERRILSWIDGDKFHDFIERDLVKTMTNYIVQMTKRAEYVRRFGNEGERIQEAIDSAWALELLGDEAATQDVIDEYSAALDEWKTISFPSYEEALKGKPDLKRIAVAKFMEIKKGGTETLEQAKQRAYEAISTPVKAVTALEGTIGRDIKAATRTLSQGLIAYQSARVLIRALFNSFQDVVGLAVRGGSLEDSYNAFVRGIRDVVRNWKTMSGVDSAYVPDMLEELAVRLGTAESGLYMASLGEMYTSVYAGNSAIRKFNEFFFRFNGMSAWNRAMRIQATGAAIAFLNNHFNRPGEHSARYLKELGLDPRQKDKYFNADTGELDYDNPAVQIAIKRWVDSAVLTPNASERPIHASDPHYAIFYNLKQFTYSFHKVIIERIVHEAKHGNYSPAAVSLVGYIPVAIAGGILKNVLTPFDDDPIWMRSVSGVVEHGIDRSGLLGVPQLFLEATPIIGRGDIAGLFGPTVEMSVDTLLGPFKERENAAHIISNVLPGAEILNQYTR